LSNAEVDVLAINACGSIFAGTTGDGVYQSTDNGNSWAQINDGLTTKTVLSLAFNSAGQMLAGTEGGGVFRTVRPITSMEHGFAETPRTFSLEQNYPNPFNPSTTIRYVLPKASRVVLKVYDVLGRDVKTLVQETQSAGEHNAIFDASGFPSGLYFYRFQAGEFVQTKRLVLVK
jgi:hypothetical protein